VSKGDRRQPHGRLAELAGVTGPTVYKWCQDGLLPDQAAKVGSGNHRIYTERDLAVGEALAVVTRALDSWERRNSRRLIGEAVREAVLAGQRSVQVPLTPGFSVVVQW